MVFVAYFPLSHNVCCGKAHGNVVGSMRWMCVVPLMSVETHHTPLVFYHTDNIKMVSKVACLSVK